MPLGPELEHPVTKRHRRWAVGCTVLVGLACGGTSKLEGSLASLMSLSYQRAEIQQGATALSIRFLKPLDGGTGDDIVLEVSARTAGLTWDAGQSVELDLAELLPDERPRGVVSRNVTGDPRTTFPPIVRGRWTLSTVPEAGAKIHGELNATFESGTEAASGRTVYGSYEGKVP